jgi:hypothetical protein
MKAILEDRYGGTYSGGKWLVIGSYYTELTTDELAWLNSHLRDTDTFYTTGSFAKYKLDRDSSLELGATRMDAVESTMQGADCYAHWNWELMPWLKAIDNLGDL